MPMPVNGQLHALAWVKYPMVPSGPKTTGTRALPGRCEEENLAITGKITLISLSLCLVTLSADPFRCLGSSTNAVNKQQINKHTDTIYP
jgi:hypothetical protein